jgi:hypothetical protein
MRPMPRLGQINLALVSLYFVPAWGHDALRALTSPYGGFEDRAHAAVAALIREAFNFGLTGLLRTSSFLAGVKLVIAAAFLAYLIEFARAVLARREPNAETIDAVLLAGLAAVTLWMLPTLAPGDLGLLREEVPQFLLLVGAAIVIAIERHIDGAEARLPAGEASRGSELALPACAPPAPRPGLPAGQPA